MAEKINCVAVKENFTEFVEKLSDLAALGDYIKIKIDLNNIFIYSTETSTTGTMLSFKSYVLSTNKYFIFKEDFQPMFFVTRESKKFVNNLKFISIQENIKIQFLTGGSQIKMFKITDGRFNYSDLSAEEFKIKDMTIATLDSFLSMDNCRWNIKINEKDLKDVRKLAQINSEEKIISIKADHKKIKFSQSNIWGLEVSDTEFEDKNVNFDKKYLGFINNENEIINLYVYDTFLLFKEDQKNLMIGIEQEL